MGLDPETARLGDVWRDPSPGAGHNFHLRQHPNEKPLSLMGNLVQLCSNPGDLVLDPFCGSGTTLVAAKAAGRRAVGVEIEEQYCQIAAERCSQEVLAVA
jgi:site-specific DNA-methyltransferase (adenine-specific)